MDWILLAVLLGSMLVGAWRGLVYEVMSVLGWVAAFVLAQWYGPDVAMRLPMEGASEPLRFAAGFVLVLVAAALTGGLVAALTSRIVSAMGLRPVDRTLGAAFGLVRGGVLLLAFAVVIGMTPLRQGEWWQGSVGASVLGAALKGLKPVLPESFGKYLPA